MLGLRACRSTLQIVTKTPSVAANYSQNAPLPNIFGQTTTSTPQVDSQPQNPGRMSVFGQMQNSTASDLLDDLMGPPASPSVPSPPSSSAPPMGLAYERPRYRLHCSSQRTSTIVTFTKPNGDTMTWNSGGSVGYKKHNRESFEAGYQCAVRTFKVIEEVAKKEGPFYIELYLKGFGMGRDAMEKALQLSEGEYVRPLIIAITDRTPIKIGGTRSQKPKYR